MAAEQSAYGGPPLNVESWIDRGSPGNWLTGKGGTGDVAHFEISHDPYAEGQWVHEYAAGRKAFQEPRIEAARSFTDENKPAQAVISARMAQEIPWRGGGFMYNQGAVVRAMGLENYVDEDKVKRLAQGGTKGMEGLWADLDRMHMAMQEAFDNPYETKQELDGIVSKGREAIQDNEIEAWTAAANFFGDSGDLHAAGVGAVELGAAHEKGGQTKEAIATYIAASQLLKRQADIIRDQGNPSRHTAEMDELSSQLVQALSAVVRLYSASGSLKGQDKEVVKAAVYDLDDLGASATTVQNGYELLAKSSHLREKHFYKREAAGIAGELAVAHFFDENPGSILMGGPEPRRDRKFQRPPVAQPQKVN